VIERFKTIPGVKQRTAEVIIAECGLDMGRFPTPAHVASWAGMCLGNNESAGKRKSGETRQMRPSRRTGRKEDTADAERKPTSTPSVKKKLAKHPQ